MTAGWPALLMVTFVGLVLAVCLWLVGSGDSVWTVPAT